LERDRNGLFQGTNHILASENEENHGKNQLGLSITCPRFELDTSGIEIYSVIATSQKEIRCVRHMSNAFLTSDLGPGPWSLGYYTAHSSLGVLGSGTVYLCGRTTR